MPSSGSGMVGSGGWGARGPSLREEARVARALELGASDYVVKPVLFRQLHECVERLASQPPEPPADA